MNKVLIPQGLKSPLDLFQKIPLRMRMTSILLASFLSTQASAGTLFSQSTNASLEMNDVTVEEVLNEIEANSEYTFLYNSKIINVDRRVSVKADPGNVEQILKELFGGTDIIYKINDKHIVLSKRESENTIETSVQQKKSVTGTVVDASGIPIIGANVMVKGTTNGTITDMDGRFSLDVPEGSILEISYIGYLSQNIKVTGTNMSVVLREDTQKLEEVVVVGYGTQTKVNLTGAVSTIGKDDLIDRPVTNVSSALQGLSPGVTVTSGTGQPGKDNSTIRIRGVGTLNNADPYILVDGIETGNFDSIDPNDIESISVLKDAASAAIYGSKAANGVILVTTKRGKQGKTAVSYNGNVSFSNVTTLIDRLSSYDYARLYNQLLVNDGASPRFDDNDLNLFKNGTDPYEHPNTNWNDYIYQTGFMHKHNLNVSGGSENVKFMTSGGFLGQEGTLKNSDRQQFNLRTNLDIKLSDKFVMRTNMAFIHNNYSEPNASYGGGSTQFIWQANRIAPWIPYKKEDGSYGSISDGNPAAWIDIDSRKYNLQQNFSGLMAFDYKIIDGLTFTLQGAYVTNINENKDYRKECWYDDTNYHGPDQLTETISRWSRYTLDALVNYDKTFNKIHNLKILGGYKIEKYDYRKVTAFRKDFPNSEITDINGGDSSTQTNSGYSRELALLSYFGRVNYDYKGKYLLEANFRADASSRFAKGFRWGYFPSFSAGWRISEEDFMEGTKGWLQSLKFRGSWGLLGNQDAVSDEYYPSLPTLYIGKNYPFGGVVSQGITVVSHKVTTISWEKSKNWGIGFDANFLDEFILSAEYYNRKTSDIIMDIPVSDTFGISGTYQDNKGSLRNSGVEVSLSWNHSFNKDWRMGINANFSYNKNELIDLSGVDEIVDGYTINRIGEAYNSFYVYEVDGLFNSDEEAAAYEEQYGNPWSLPFKGGDFRIKDTDGDGKLTEKDRVIKGAQQPNLTYGLNISAGWKNFDLSIFVQGVSGVNRYFTRDVVGSFIGDTSHPSTNWLEAWTPENKNAEWPRMFLEETSISAPNRVYSSFWCMNTDYMRIKNINLSYTLPKSFTDKLGISNAKIYYTGENLFTFDSLPFNADPEAPSGNLDIYPTNRSHSLGINITF